MKRSEINQLIRVNDAFAREHHFFLPPFAYWTPDEWRNKGPEAAEIVHNQMGWDITDFGSGDFARVGLFLFTIRNGHPTNWQKKQGKVYAEKLLVVGVDQVTPFHYHWSKTEDIINRGGGRLLIQMYNSTPEDTYDETTPVKVSTDGVARTLPAGGVVELKPGESITLTTGLFHKFWGADETVLVGEVSQVNDDTTDNNFQPIVGRFPTIEEDEEPLYLLVKDYPKYYKYT
jgi:D-lyxose ketol-isomerase